ncbi:MAG: hypothetical protein K8H84_10970 [Sulfuricella denitrificans]|nr:hypothetical protein [Sulfuricella denitrificans]
MKVKAIRGFCLGGIGNDAHPGDLLDLPDHTAAMLIQRGKVVAVVALTEQDPEPKPAKRKGAKNAD